MSVFLNQLNIKNGVSIYFFVFTHFNCQVFLCTREKKIIYSLEYIDAMPHASCYKIWWIDICVPNTLQIHLLKSFTLTVLVLREETSGRWLSPKGSNIINGISGLTRRYSLDLCHTREHIKLFVTREQALARCQSFRNLALVLSSLTMLRVNCFLNHLVSSKVLQEPKLRARILVFNDNIDQNRERGDGFGKQRHVYWDEPLTSINVHLRVQGMLSPVFLL